MAIADLVLRFLTMGVTAFGVVVAFVGLKTWRRQLHGKASFDLARRFAMAVYTVRNRIRQCRNQMAQESQEVLMKRLGEAVADVETCALEAEILWGASVRNAKDGLMQCILEYWRAVRREIRMAKAPERKWKEGEQEKIDAVIFGDDDDEFGKKVTDAVQGLENVLRPHLPKRS